MLEVFNMGPVSRSAVRFPFRFSVVATSAFAGQKIVRSLYGTIKPENKPFSGWHVLDGDRPHVLYAYCLCPPPL